MRKIKLEPAIGSMDNYGITGTAAVLRTLLAAKCPAAATYEGQKMFHRVMRGVGPEFLIIEDEAYDWLMDALQDVDFKDMYVGKLIMALEDAERLES